MKQIHPHTPTINHMYVVYTHVIPLVQRFLVHVWETQCSVYLTWSYNNEVEHTSLHVCNETKSQVNTTTKHVLKCFSYYELTTDLNGVLEIMTHLLCQSSRIVVN